jgi:hypothetical protein
MTNDNEKLPKFSRQTPWSVVSNQSKAYLDLMEILDSMGCRGGALIPREDTRSATPSVAASQCQRSPALRERIRTKKNLSPFAVRTAY